MDIKSSLITRYQQIDPAVLYERAIDYLSSQGENTSNLKSVDRSKVDFYDDYALLITNFSYGNTTKSMGEVTAHEQTYINSSPDNPLEATFTYTESRQDAQTFKFTEGLKVGAKASFKAKLPFVGEATTEVSAEATFSAEQTVATTVTTTWQFAEKITVKPTTAVKATGFISIAKLNAPFTCNVQVTGGKVLVWFRITDGTWTETPIPVTAIMTDEDRSFILSGNFDGSEAAETYVKVVPAAIAASA